jgi:hypothetical protein
MSVRPQHSGPRVAGCARDRDAAPRPRAAPRAPACAFSGSKVIAERVDQQHDVGPLVVAQARRATGSSRAPRGASARFAEIPRTFSPIQRAPGSLRAARKAGANAPPSAAASRTGARGA